MERKVFGLILGTLVAKSSFAIVIHNGNLIEHREWTTGKVAVQEKVLAHDAKTDLMTLRASQKSHSESIEGMDGILLVNKLFGTEGFTEQKTDIEGGIEAYIENNSLSSQIYKVSINFCITSIKGKSTDDCAHSSYQIQLDSGGYAELATKRTLSHTFGVAGIYKATLATLAERENLSSYFATYDKGYVSITSNPNSN